MAPKEQKPLEDMIQVRVGAGVAEWLEKKRQKHERERGRKVTQSEFVRFFLESLMLEERQRQKAAL